jgi:hypothetical protein
MMIFAFCSVLSFIAFSSVDATSPTMPDVLPVKTERALKGRDKGDHPPTKGSRRMTMHSRTTLINLDVDELTPEQILFFEDTWMQAFNDIHVGDDTEDNSDTRVRSFVVDDVHRGDRPGGDRRGLRGGDAASLGSERSLFYTIPTNWFDILALFESSCILCAHDDDRRLAVDDTTHRLFETSLCDSLREGPFECYRELDDCRVVYFSN